MIPLGLLCTNNYLNRSTHRTLVHLFMWLFLKIVLCWAKNLIHLLCA